MSFLNDVVPISYAVGLVGVAGSLFSFMRFNNYKSTVQLQNDNIKALEDQANIHSAMLNDNKSTIDSLRTRIEVVETLPLEAILTELKTISNTQNQMLKNLIGKK
jgi:hypothetical protein